MYHFGLWGFPGFWGFPGMWGFGWIAAVIAIIPFWKICTRVGLSPWLSLLLIVPLANLIFVYYLAFTQWPAFGPNPGAVGGMGYPPGPGTGPGQPGPGPGGTGAA